jgi:hypothetical protein
MSGVGAFERRVSEIIKIIDVEHIKICVGTLIITIMKYLEGSKAAIYSSIFAKKQFLVNTLLMVINSFNSKWLLYEVRPF